MTLTKKATFRAHKSEYRTQLPNGAIMAKNILKFNVFFQLKLYCLIWLPSPSPMNGRIRISTFMKVHIIVLPIVPLTDPAVFREGDRIQVK